MAKIDGRSAEGRFLRRVRAEMTEHVGGKPDAAQRTLINRIGFLSLRIAQMDSKAVGGTLTELDHRTYLAWVNTLRRCIAGLGPAAPPADQPNTLAEHIAARRATAA